MTLGEKLNSDYIASYKNKDTVRLNVLRLLKTAITNRMVELKQHGDIPDDSAIIELLLKQAKQRKDSIQQYTDAKRLDLAQKEADELKILEEYLPAQLSDEQISEAVDEVISETGASSPQDMGKVIGAVMAKYKGQVDGKKVSALTRQKLAIR